MAKFTVKIKGSSKLLILYISAAMLIAANAGLPDGFFWTKFVISILLARIIAWRGFLEKPVDLPTEEIEIPKQEQ